MAGGDGSVDGLVDGGGDVGAGSGPAEQPGEVDAQFGAGDAVGGGGEPEYAGVQFFGWDVVDGAVGGRVGAGQSYLVVCLAWGAQETAVVAVDLAVADQVLDDLVKCGADAAAGAG